MLLRLRSAAQKPAMATALFLAAVLQVGHVHPGGAVFPVLVKAAVVRQGVVIKKN